MGQGVSGKSQMGHVERVTPVPVWLEHGSVWLEHSGRGRGSRPLDCC